MVPVFWFDHNGNQITSHTQIGHPFLVMEVTADEPGPDAKWIKTLGLIDTGSSAGRVENSLISELNAIQSGSSTFVGNTGHETVNSYRLNWRPAHAPNFIITENAAALDVSLGIFGARALIGMSILKFGSLFLDPHKGQGAFQIHMDRFLSPTGNQ